MEVRSGLRRPSRCSSGKIMSPQHKQTERIVLAIQEHDTEEEGNLDGFMTIIARCPIVKKSYDDRLLTMQKNDEAPVVSHGT